jgi:hypothetical protein
MRAAPPHEREAERLDALARYGVLDTPPEEEFDELARLVSAICGTPIALVSLVDADRQSFKARVGLEPRETPREMAFCAHAILEPDVFVVPDTLQDERSQSALFERLRQVATSDARKNGGAGLGLAISRAIMEAHGGTLACEEPASGSGSVFVARLPAGGA